jgi:hypothetical protein
MVLREDLLHDLATTRKLDVAAALRIAGTGVAEDEPIKILASNFVLRVQSR